MANKDLVQSLLRGIEILEMLSKSNEGMRLNEIAKRLDVKDPTAHNLLRTLASKDYARKTPENLYSLGNAAWSLGDRNKEQVFSKRIMEEMEKLSAALPGKTITYCELSGKRVKISFRIHGKTSGEIQQPDNMFLHLYANASGLAFQAFAENEESLLDLREDAPFYEHGAHLWKTPSKLKAFLLDAKEKSYVVPPFDNQDFFRVAAPVFGKQKNLLGAIGASARSKGIKNEKEKTNIINATLAAAKKLSQA